VDGKREKELGIRERERERESFIRGKGGNGGWVKLVKKKGKEKCGRKKKGKKRKELLYEYLINIILLG